MSVPENHITVYGNTLNEALSSAASQLSIEPGLVAYDFDRDHFKNESGRPKGVLKVQIFAWKLDAKTIEGAESAQSWLKSLTDLIGIETAVRYDITGDKTAKIILDTEQAGRIVGRKGASLQSISYVFKAAMQKDHSDWTFNIDVTGGQRNESEGSRDRDRDGGSRGRKGKTDVRKLENRANRLANKVLKSGEPLEMFGELNSFERRIVHQTVQDIEGVTSKSVEVDGVKKVHIIPAEQED